MKPISELTRQKMRLAKLGKKASVGTRRKMSLSHIGNKSNTGRKLPESHKQNISAALKNKAKPLQKGKSLPETTVIKMRGRIREKSPKWKGNDASYSAKHHHLRLHFGKADRCDNPNCVYPRKTGKKVILNPKIFQWALIRGRTYTHNREDYLRLCASCHRLYDNKTIDIELIISNSN